MGGQTKGKCKYCGKEYTKSYMIRHLAGCKERMAGIAAKKGTKRCGYYELAITGKYDKAYWLIIEISENATLKDLDSFLRDIWLECCGHLSAFEIYGTSYEIAPDSDSFWGKPAKSMNYKLKSVLQKGMVINYEYDFGSTTELVINVQEYRESYWKKDNLVILSRNNPPEILCDECNEKPAVVVCTQCIYEGTGFLCDDCKETHECGEDMQLMVCNSPRMGVCGYEGSVLYPDQFVPDKEK